MQTDKRGKIHHASHIKLRIRAKGLTLMVISIPLSKNGKKYVGKYEAIVSDEDGDLAKLTWYAQRDSRNPEYVTCSTSKYINGAYVRTKMHRIILSRILNRPLEKHELVDHKDGNPLNNTRENVRLANSKQNAYNTRRAKDNKSGYKGVHFEKGKWSARIMVNKKFLRLGRYNTPEEAHEAYKKAAIEHFGEFARFE